MIGQVELDTMEFSHLNEREIIEVVDDMLLEDCIEYKDELIELIKSLEIITIDNIKQIVFEVNIHKKSPNELIQDMNISRAGNRYDIMMMHNNSTRTVKRKYDGFETASIGIGSRIYGIGDVVGFNEDGTIVANVCRYYDEYFTRDEETKFDKFLEKNNISTYESYIEIVERLGEEIASKVLRTFKLEKCQIVHDTFKTESEKMYI